MQIQKLLSHSVTAAALKLSCAHLSPTKIVPLKYKQQGCAGIDLMFQLITDIFDEAFVGPFATGALTVADVVGLAIWYA